jgi:uncharacterized membrane protein required for colicin V production
VEADIALVFFFAGALLLGIFRGAVRQLIALGAWAIALIVAAYLRGTVGDWIAAQAHQYSREHVEMLAFALVFLVLFTVALLVIEIGGSTIRLTQRPAVDEILGGLLGLGVAVLTVGALLIVFDSYYAMNPPQGAVEFAFARAVHSALERSAIAKSLHGSLVPGLIALLGPLLPGDIRAVYG